jgi:hypothetical protein
MPLTEDDQRFIDTYVACFLATWTALRYDEACAMDQHDRLRHPPVEDAADLAIDALRAYDDVPYPEKPT